MSTATTFTFSNAAPLTVTVTTISASTYGNNTNLTSVTFGSIVTTLSNYAFYTCTQLTSFTLPNTITTMGVGVMSFCSNLVSCVIPTNGALTTVPDYTFADCPHLTTLTIPSTYTAMGAECFRNNYALTSIVFPNSFTSIGQASFFNCTSLTSVTLPVNASYTTITAGLFRGCSSLTSITIPSNVTTMLTGSFAFCTGFTTFPIPSTVTTIQDNCFSSCTGLTTMTLPITLASLGASCFTNCSHLAMVYIADSRVNPSTIGNGAFSNINSAGTPNYPTVTFYYANSAADTTPALQAVTWPTNSILVYNPSCFAPDTCILCLVVSPEQQEHQWTETWIRVQDLSPGMLVKSYLHGYRRLKAMGKGHAHTSVHNPKSYLYSLVSPHAHHRPLTITGEHSILLNPEEWTQKETQEYVDDKVMVMACLSDRFVKREDVSEYDYYHFILENDGDTNRRYGVWADGQLVETPTETCFYSFPYTLG